MKRNLLTMLAIATTVAGLAASSTQQPGDDERRAAVTVMRAINTAENAIRQSSGKYVELAALLDHPMMSRVKTNIVVNGNTVTHVGAQVRLALSADAAGYQVMVVPATTCGTAAFSDERGLIYTGKVLDC
jgi:hypothetical protein